MRASIPAPVIRCGPGLWRPHYQAGSDTSLYQRLPTGSLSPARRRAHREAHAAPEYQGPCARGVARRPRELRNRQPAGRSQHRAGPSGSVHHEDGGQGLGGRWQSGHLHDHRNEPRPDIGRQRFRARHTPDRPHALEPHGQRRDLVRSGDGHLEHRNAGGQRHRHAECGSDGECRHRGHGAREPSRGRGVSDGHQSPEQPRHCVRPLTRSTGSEPAGIHDAADQHQRRCRLRGCRGCARLAGQCRLWLYGQRLDRNQQRHRHCWRPSLRNDDSGRRCRRRYVQRVER